MTTIRRNPDSEQKSYTELPQTFHAALLKCPKPALTALLPRDTSCSLYPSVWSLADSNLKRYHLQTAVGRGEGFLVTTAVCYKKEVHLLTEIEMCWPLWNYQVPPFTVSPLQWSIASKTPKESEIWCFRPILRRVHKGLSPTSCLVGSTSQAEVWITWELNRDFGSSCELFPFNSGRKLCRVGCKETITKAL